MTYREGASPTIEQSDPAADVEELIRTGTAEATAVSVEQQVDQPEQQEFKSHEIAREYITDLLDRATRLRALREQIEAVTREHIEKRGAITELHVPLRKAEHELDAAIRQLVRSAKETFDGYSGRIKGVTFEDWQEAILKEQ
jgi:hypothetical protein